MRKRRKCTVICQKLLDRVAGAQAALEKRLSAKLSIDDVSSERTKQQLAEIEHDINAGRELEMAPTRLRGILVGLKAADFGAKHA